MNKITSIDGSIKDTAINEFISKIPTLLLPIIQEFANLYDEHREKYINAQSSHSLPSIHHFDKTWDKEKCSLLCDRLIQLNRLPKNTSHDDFYYYMTGKSDYPDSSLSWQQSARDLAIFINLLTSDNNEVWTEEDRWKKAEAIFGKNNLVQAHWNAKETALYAKKHVLFKEVLEDIGLH